MINDPRNRQRIYKAIEALQPVADEHQHHINCLATHAQLSVGQLLQIGRTIDTIERALGDLHGLLDQPPGLGGAEPPRALSRPIRPVDRKPEPGMAVAAAGDSGSAAA